MSSIERKIKRNELRSKHGNKGIRKEFRLYQVYKYGIGNYAKMQHISEKKVLEEDI